MAVFPEEPGAVAAADLLTAGFSRIEKLQLVERAESERIYREQALSLSNHNYLKLGQLLGANGLLLLSPLTEGTNRFLQGRLVAVGPGVVIGSFRSPWPIAEETRWAEWVVHRFVPLLPKLTVLAKDAVPISIVNFSAAVRSPEEQELEQQLTLLTTDRLSRERDLFVLERQRMELLTSEKDLRNGSEAAFWNGSYLLEGVVDRLGYSKEKMTLSARLMPPGGGAPVTFELAGSRTNLSDLLQHLTKEISKALKLTPAGSSWAPPEEAARYFQEAMWAFRWGMLTEARSACECSWALGHQNKEAAELRVRIYGEAGAPPRSSFASLNPTSPAYAPDPARLDPAIRALDLYRQGLGSFILAEGKPDTNWFNLGLHLLGSELLRQFNYFPEICRGHEEQLATLRLMSRSTAAMLQEQSLSTNLSRSMVLFRLGSSEPYALHGQVMEPNLDFPLTGYGGAYWPDTPEESLAQYRALADTPFLHTARMLFAYHHLASWNQDDKARAPALWRGFINELCASTNALKRVEGYWLAFADAPPSSQPDRAQAFFNVAVQDARPLVGAHLHERLVTDIDHLIAEPPNGFSTDADGEVRQRFTAFRTAFAEACDAAMRSLRLEAMTKYLLARLSQGQSPGPYYKFDELFSRGVGYPLRDPSYQSSEAAVLLPLLQQFQTNLQAQALQNEPNARIILQRVEALLTQLGPLTAGSGGPPAPTSLTKAAKQQVGPLSPKTRPLLSRTVVRRVPPLGMFATNSLRSSRFWQFPTNLVDDFDMVPRAGEACFRNGRLWVEVLYKSQDVYLRKAFLFGLDPSSFSTEKIELPVVNHKFVISSAETRDHFETGDSFEVLDDQVFFSVGDKIKRYSLAKKVWDDLSVQTVGRLTVLDGRLYASTDDSIIEISPNGNSETILASARRRPAATILDSLEHYGNPRLFRGPSSSLATWLQNHLYVFDRAAMAWLEITGLPGPPTTVSNAATGGNKASAYQAVAWGTNQLFIPADPNSTVLAAPQPASLSLSNHSPRQCRLEDPLWVNPKRRDLAASRLILAQTGTWLLFGQQSMRSQPSSLSSSGSSAPPLVYAVWKDEPVAMAIPLALDLRQATISPELLRHLTYGNYGSGELSVQPVPTPAGVALINAHVGVWLLPWNEVDRAVQAAQEQRRTQRQTRTAAERELWAELFRKYHLTQTDHISREQKAAMIENPVFLELNLDQIDANRNGKLDGFELAYFDANQDGILEPAEQAGLEEALNLLAQDLLDEFDLDGDGTLDRTEFERLIQDTGEQPPLRRPPNFNEFDLNQDKVLSAVELQAFLRQQMVSSIQPNNYPAGTLSPELVKTLIERYWAQSAPGAQRSLTRAPLNPPPKNPLSQRPEETLLEAVAGGNLAGAGSALEQGADVNVRDDRGWTPLMIAAKGGRLDVAKLLVEKGADVNARSTSQAGSTVLCFATDSDNPELLALLVAHGADVNGKSRNLGTPLLTAVSNGKKAAAKFLIAHGAHVNEFSGFNDPKQQYTPLMAAALTGDSELTQVLLQAGARLESTNSSGDTALMLTAKTKHAETLQLLIERGANVNARGPRGHTALMYAAYNGQLDNVKLLLAAGADPEATAADSDIPGSPRYDAVQLAEQQHQPEIAALLREGRPPTQRKP